MIRPFILIAIFVSLLFTVNAVPDLNQPPAPVLVSAEQSSNYQFVTLSWTSSYQCQSGDFCFFQLLRDNNVSITVVVTNGESSYVRAVYFGTGPNDLTYGTHSFFIKLYNFAGPSPSSNIVTGTFVSPPVTPPDNGGDIVGDPQFMGLKGQVYQVHGAPNEVFNIISDIDLQYNSRFIFLDSGDCPTRNGQPVDTPCFTHPGTYLGELGLETALGDRLYVKAGGAAFGFQKVELNGNTVPIGELIELKQPGSTETGFVMYNSSHVLTLQTGNFRLEFTNSDMFVNQVVQMLDATRQTSHGLLGQSWSTKVHNAKASIPWIEGTVWDYVLEDNKLFSNKFTFNQFHLDGVDAAEEDEVEKANEARQLANQANQSDLALVKMAQQMKKRLIKQKH